MGQNSANNSKRKIATRQALDSSAPAATVFVYDTAHGVTDAKGIATSQAMRDALVKRASGAVQAPSSAVGSMMHRAGMGLAKINPALMAVSSVASASSTYNATLDAGGTQTQAATGAAIAATPMAVAAAAPAVIGKLAPAFAAVISKAAVPLTAAAALYGAGRKGYLSYQRGDSTGQVAVQAGLGAADSLSFGLASMAYEGRVSAMVDKFTSAAKPVVAKVSAFLNPAAEAKAASDRRTVADAASAEGPGRAVAKPRPRHDGPVDVQTYTRGNGVTVSAYERAARAYQ